MASIALEFLLCVLAFWFGYSANQGGTCLVVAAHEIQKRRPPRMFVGFLAASAAAGLISIPLVWSGALGATLTPSTSINWLLLVGQWASDKRSEKGPFNVVEGSPLYGIFSE